MIKGSVVQGSLRVDLQAGDAGSLDELSRRAHDLRGALSTLRYALGDIESILRQQQPLGDMKVKQIHKAIDCLQRECGWVVELFESTER